MSSGLEFSQLLATRHKGANTTCSPSSSMAPASSPPAQPFNMCMSASASASSPLSPSSPAKTGQPEQPAYPPYSLFHPPPYSPTPTTGPAQERAILALSSHKRSSYDAIPIDHAAPINTSSETRASLAPGAPPRFLPPSPGPSRNALGLDPSLKAHSNVIADNSIVTNALAALNASRSMALGTGPGSSPGPGAAENTEQ